MEQEPTVNQTSEPSKWECSMCGKDGGPTADCELCHGRKDLLQERHFTLSEERQGKNPNADDRYGSMGEVGPKIVVLPGGALPGSGGPR